MKKYRILAGILSVLMVAAMFTGCGERGNTETTGGDSAAAPAEYVDISTEPIKIAAAVANMDTNTTLWVEGMETFYADYPNVTFQVFTATGSAETQSQQFDEIINQEFDGVILHPVDPAAIASKVADAEAAGINVWHINIGVDVPHTGGIEGDSHVVGQMVAEDMIQRLGGQGKVVAIGPPVEMSAVMFCVDGLKETLATADGIEFLEEQSGDWTTEKGNAIMRDYLSKYNNDIQAVFANNDQMAIGAAQAIEAAGLTGKILVYGADGTQEALDYIQEGKMTGTYAVDSRLIGTTAAEFVLYAVASGVNGGELPTTPLISPIKTLITADNIDD